MLFLNPPYMAFEHLMIPRIAAVGTSFNPLPCQAWHGYGVTSAHCVEVEVGADEHASSPPCGAAAAALPAAASSRHFVKLCPGLWHCLVINSSSLIVMLLLLEGRRLHDDVEIR
jgi:hypothetical protein